METRILLTTFYYEKNLENGANHWNGIDINASKRADCSATALSGGKGVDIHKVYDVVEKMPTLPNGGGQQAIASLLQQTVLIPQGEKAEGQVIVQFIVDRKGKPDKIKIIKSPTPALGKAVESAVRKLPHLTPGMQNGVTTNVQLQMAVALTAKQ